MFGLKQTSHLDEVTDLDLETMSKLSIFNSPKIHVTQSFIHKSQDSKFIILKEHVSQSKI